MAEVEKKLESLSLAFSKHQQQMNDLVQSRSQLETQFQENKIVKEEFSSLDSNSKIYKLTGPVLLPQDFSEAQLNVDKRIEFINNEIDRVEEKIASEEKEAEKIRNEIVAMKLQAGQ
ncbi:YKE2 [Candida oxycetoniae]|uniref:YKE2 n=1 Tax=Candida oxycetoniae TaxID=497107 RepID=A0AAI9T1Z3_9ASCO|nr:YKE2 [Candida oxycetoniae]KAI3406944.1 YKE2 [Candida oxycetoniae]